jgi:hypothetical protein
LWRLNYRYLEKHRTLAFGAWPDVSLANARLRRDEARRLIAAGTNPSHQQKVELARARVEENDTFKTVAEEWIAKNGREGMAEITLSKIRWLLDKAYPRIDWSRGGGGSIRGRRFAGTMAGTPASHALTGRNDSSTRSLPVSSRQRRVICRIAAGPR